MGADSKIQWTHHTFNPWRGCTKVSAGCAHCYADTLSRRNPKVLGVWGPNGTRVIAAEDYWALPLRWNKYCASLGQRRRVFCASLADVFEGEDTMPEAAREPVRYARARLFDLIDRTPNLYWLLLTKRPENIRKMWPGGFYGRYGFALILMRRHNVWLMTSVEDQPSADKRIPELLKCRDLAPVLGLSCEPLLGPINLQRIKCIGAGFVDALDGRGHDGSQSGGTYFKDDSADASIDWVIVGGESGGSARPCDVQWIESIIAQCREANVACFVKQLGAHVVIPHSTGNARADAIAKKHGLNLVEQHVQLPDKKGGDPDDWPEHMRVRQFPAVNYPLSTIH